MKITSEMLVREHLDYASSHPEETKRYPTLYEHMLYYFHSVWGMSESETHRLFGEFGTHISSSGPIDQFGHPSYRPSHLESSEDAVIRLYN